MLINITFSPPIKCYQAIYNMNKSLFRIIFQAIWLDTNEESIQAAESLGMTAVKITNISEAMMAIEKVTEIKVMFLLCVKCI